LSPTLSQPAIILAGAFLLVGVVTALYGLALSILRRRARANPGDALLAFGAIATMVGLRVLLLDDMGYVVVGTVVTIRMVTALLQALDERRRPSEKAKTPRSDADEPVKAADTIPAAAPALAPTPTPLAKTEEPSDETVVRFATPIDAEDLFKRPDRPRMAMEAVLKQLGAGAQVVGIRARRGPVEG